MSMEVELLIRGRELVTVPSDTSIQAAVQRMVDGDFSQLPVVDERGRVVGLFTERKLTKAIMMGMGCDIVDSPVSQFMEHPVKTVSPSTPINDVARLLVDTYAVVVGHNYRPLGIVTDYDIAVYLSDWSRGIALVEDIESRLRGYIERVYPTANARDAAIHKALGHGKDDPILPVKRYEELTLAEHVQLIVAQENWPKFEPYFKPKVVFRKMLEPAVPIRNQIAHFRGKLTSWQIATLDTARDFLAHCPHVPVNTADKPR